MKDFDVIVIGAGAAGMMAAIEAGKRGRSVAILEHNAIPGRKILISGGGRCNFTNLHATPENYVSSNPHFCKSALARYTQHDFIGLVEAHKIAYHEKTLGQLFCDNSAQAIVDMLITECQQANVQLLFNYHVKTVTKNKCFELTTNREDFSCGSLIIATGGLSVPKVGATSFGYDMAEQFGLNILPTTPALDGFVFTKRNKETFSELTGVATPAKLSTGGLSFEEAILFTHRGLSGPASLQGSLHWQPNTAVEVNLIPKMDQEALLAWLENAKVKKPNLATKTLLAEHLPKRLAEKLCLLSKADKPIGKLSETTLQTLIQTLQHWQFIPSGTVGYQKAEVTRGGIDTDELSSKTMESKKVPGLFFIGEVVDVTGWLGGYNFQWAWSSGWAAGQVA